MSLADAYPGSTRDQSGVIGYEDALRQIALDAFLFWPLQVTEHMLVLSLGLEDDQLKQLAYTLHLEWLRFVPQGNSRVPLYDEIDWPRLLALVEQTRAFQIQVRDLIETCSGWQGWLSGAYLKHITEELDYFAKKIQLQPTSIDEEFLFWLDIFKDHAGTVAGFIDPRERNDIHQANGHADDLLAVIAQYQDRVASVQEEGSDLPRSSTLDVSLDPEVVAMQQVSLLHADQLERWYQNFIGRMQQCQVKTSLHPVLAAHIEREHQYGLALLSLLVGNTTQI